MMRSVGFLLGFLSLFLGSAAASIVVVSNSRTGPNVFSSAEGGPLVGGLTRLGTLSGIPRSGQIADIDATFVEFGSGVTDSGGRLSNLYTNSAATPFDDRQIYLWILDGFTVAGSTRHGLLTVADVDHPSQGSPWRFPIHTGSGTDVVTISLVALLDGGTDQSIPGAPLIDSTAGDRRIILQIPEPSGATLLLVGVLVVVPRRRPITLR